MRVFGILRRCAWVVLAALVSGCVGVSEPVVFGTVAYRERMVLPPNARLEVALVGLPRAEGPAETIANIAIDNPGTPPIRFALAYDPARIDPARVYAVEATIRAGDRVLFRSVDRFPVLTHDNPSKVSVVVYRAPAPPPPPPAARLTPAERALAAMRAKLDRLEKIGGSYTTGEAEATYEAFLEGDALVAVREARTFGDQGSAQVAFYYRDGTLLAYEEDASRQARSAAAGAGAVSRTTLTLNFTGGRYANGRKTVNGAAAGEPSETEIKDAVAEARAARDRLISDAAMGRTSAGLGPVRFGCADGTRFLVTFNHEPLRAVITAVGHPSTVLLPQPTRAGYRFVDGRTELRGNGREVDMRWEGAQPVRCTAAAP